MLQFLPTRVLPLVLLCGVCALGAAAPSSPFAGDWTGTFTRPEFTGLQAFTITDTGHLSGTFYNPVFDVGGTLNGQVRANGSFTVVGLTDTNPPHFDVSCGKFQIVGDHLVTESWGLPDQFACDNPGWSQDLERQ